MVFVNVQSFVCPGGGLSSNFTLLIVCFMFCVCFGLALPNRFLHAFDYTTCTKTDAILGLVVTFIIKQLFIINPMNSNVKVC